MSVLGILSVREESERKHKGRIQLRERDVIDLDIPVKVAEFSATAEEIRNCGPWQKRQLFRRGVRFLKKLGADAVVPTLCCGNVFHIPVQGGSMIETALMPEDMPAALETVFLEWGDSPKGKTGWLVDWQCGPSALSLLIAMSQRVEFLAIVTTEQERAEKIAEILWEEYGVIPEIYKEIRGVNWENSIAVRLDTGLILINGTTAIKGRKWSLPMEGYPIDLAGLLSGFPEFREFLQPSEWCRGKSG